MREEAVESFNHKGYKVSIYQDMDPRSPDEDKNEDLFLVGFHSDFTVRRDGFGKFVAAQAFKDRDKFLDDELDEHQKGVVRYVKKAYHIFGLEAYIHSGVVLAISREGNFPDRRWDVSQLGAVFVSKKEWPDKAKARKAALSLIREWNACLSGDVYGYVVEKEVTCDKCKHTDLDHIDSCFGYVGDFGQCKKDAIAAVEAL